MGKLTLNESEKTKIRQLHGLNGVDLINEQMDAEIAKIECRKKYGKKSEKLTKRGYTKAEEGENYEEGYKTKTIPNKECVDELWFKAKKSIKDRVRNIGDKYADKKVGKKDAAELHNLNSDVIGKIVGQAIGSLSDREINFVNLINSDSWLVSDDKGVTNNYETALKAIHGMLQLAATVETLNNWMMSNDNDCYERKIDKEAIHSAINNKYITGSPRESLKELDRITRGLTIRNKEIKELKEVVKSFKSVATEFWNDTESGLGGNDEIITKQFSDAGHRDIKDMFRRKMSQIAARAFKVVKVVEGQMFEACSTDKSKTSADNSEKY